VVTNILYIYNNHKKTRGDAKMAVEVWIVAIIKIALVLLGGHLAITKLLPLMKKLFNSFMKEEQTVAVISILLLYVGLLVANKVIEAITSIDNQYLNYITLATIPINLILSVMPYLMYFTIACVAVIGLKK